MHVLPRNTRRIALAGLAAIASLGALAPSGDAQIAERQAQADRLESAVAAESRRIAATGAGLADAQRRLAALEARAQKRQAQLQDTQDKLIRARIRLSRLERKALNATRTLRENLIQTYKAGEPNMVDVVLNANGFKDLVERVGFFRRVANRNGNILDATREAKREVANQTEMLGGLRAKFAKLSDEANTDRDQASVIRNALLRRQEIQLRSRAGTQARLTAVRGQIRTLERAAAREAAAAAARAAAAQSSSQQAPSAPAPTSAAPATGDAGSAVAKVVAAANEIASTPYVWGGGHGGASGGYDCSGSLSYALAAAGLVSSPLTSGAFMSWGEPGPGRHITVYANGGHAYMVVDGRRYDTSALSGGGTRWTSEMRSSAGFVARHPPGL